MKGLFLPIREFKEICFFQKTGIYVCQHCIETSHLEELEEFGHPKLECSPFTEGQCWAATPVQGQQHVLLMLRKEGFTQKKVLLSPSLRTMTS